MVYNNPLLLIDGYSQGILVPIVLSLLYLIYTLFGPESLTELNEPNKWPEKPNHDRKEPLKTLEDLEKEEQHIYEKLLGNKCGIFEMLQFKNLQLIKN